MLFPTTIIEFLQRRNEGGMCWDSNGARWSYTPLAVHYNGFVGRVTRDVALVNQVSKE
jgi:hypothetical protein